MRDIVAVVVVVVAVAVVVVVVVAAVVVWSLMKKYFNFIDMPIDSTDAEVL